MRIDMVSVALARDVRAPWSPRRWLPPLVLLLLGMWLVPWQHTCQLGCVPGDLGDARFNGVVLEHFHRWLTGQEAHLLSPSFFHPLPGVATFSDNHWGTAWIYAVFRALGADRYQAFDLWYLTGVALNFVVSHVVFRRMRFSPLASAVAAFAFTFAMPVISKHGHAQMTYRFLLPVGLLLWQRCLSDGRWRWFAAVSLVVTAQLYISIYLGYFLVLLLAAWTVADAVVGRCGPRQWVTQWRQRQMPSSRRERQVSCALVVLACVAAAVLLYPYLHYARLYGFGRGLGEISTMTPRLQSYLMADLSRIWGGMSLKIGAGIPARQEHQLFFGVGILGLALLGLLRSPARLLQVAAVSLLVLFLLTLTFDRYSMYLALALLPGVGAVRAVARIALVMVLPLALLVAAAMDAAPRGRWAYRLLVALLVLAMVVESATTRTNGISMSEARARTAALAPQFPTALPRDAVLFTALQPDIPYYVSELDGVILAQERNRPTLNGYSGNIAPGYAPQPELSPCAQAAARLQAAAAFQRRRPQDTLSAPVPSAAWVAGQGRCPPVP